jgi:hypothetical protein
VRRGRIARRWRPLCRGINGSSSATAASAWAGSGTGGQAEDIAQEIFLTAYRAMPQKGRTPVRPWLFAIAQKRCLRATQPGLSKAKALRQAQLRLLAGPGPLTSATSGPGRGLTLTTEASTATLPRFVQPPQAPYAHPYFWAPFILLGNWQ